jgi:hypothetical protein
MNQINKLQNYSFIVEMVAIHVHYIYVYKQAKKKPNTLGRNHEKRGKIPDQHQEKRNIQVKEKKEKKDI